MVTMAIRRREVVARSEACRIKSRCGQFGYIGGVIDGETAYLAGLLLQHQQLVNRALNIGLNQGKVSIGDTSIGRSSAPSQGPQLPGSACRRPW